MNKFNTFGVLLFAVSTLLLTGCHTKEEHAYLTMVNKTPLEFELSREAGEDAWQRAEVFLAKHCASPIKTATNQTLQTETTRDFFRQYVYYTITRSPVKNGWFFTIQHGNGCSRDAHILAHYMQTGELPYPNLIGW